MPSSLSLASVLWRRLFFEPERKQREEQESTAEISEHLTEKGMVAPTVVSGFQQNTCTGSLRILFLKSAQCLERMQVPALRRMCWNVDLRQVEYIPVTTKFWSDSPFPLVSQSISVSVTHAYNGAEAEKCRILEHQREISLEGLETLGIPK